MPGPAKPTATNNLIMEQTTFCVFCLALSLLSAASFIYYLSYPAVLPLLLIVIAMGATFTYTSYDKRQQLTKGPETPKI